MNIKEQICNWLNKEKPKETFKTELHNLWEDKAVNFTIYSGTGEITQNKHKNPEDREIINDVQRILNELYYKGIITTKNNDEDLLSRILGSKDTNLDIIINKNKLQQFIDNDYK